jgi:hypothetical protein
MSRAATIEMRGRLKHSLGAALFPAREGALFDHFLVVVRFDVVVIFNCLLLLLLLLLLLF